MQTREKLKEIIRQHSAKRLLLASIDEEIAGLNKKLAPLVTKREELASAVKLADEACEQLKAMESQSAEVTT